MGARPAAPCLSAGLLQVDEAAHLHWANHKHFLDSSLSWFLLSLLNCKGLYELKKALHARTENTCCQCAWATGFHPQTKNQHTTLLSLTCALGQAYNWFWLRVQEGRMICLHGESWNTLWSDRAGGSDRAVGCVHSTALLRAVPRTNTHRGMTERHNLDFIERILT